MIPSRRRPTWRLMPIPVCGSCGRFTSAGVSSYGKAPQTMLMRACDRCNRELLLLRLNAPEPVDDEVSARVDAMRKEAA